MMSDGINWSVIDRSEPGKGEKVGIYILNDNAVEGVLIESTEGEDYAFKCHSDVIVTAKAHLESHGLATMLEKLAALLRRNEIFVKVEPEVIRCERCGADTVAGVELAHHALCQSREGQLTDLSNEQVRDMLQMLDRYDCYVDRKPLPLGPDDVTF